MHWAREVGVYTEEYIFNVLEKKQHPEQSYKSYSGILNLGKNFGNKRLENACKRALEYEKYSYHMVKSILEKGLNAFHEDITYEEKEIPKHKNIRGGSYYQ